MRSAATQIRDAANANGIDIKNAAGSLAHVIAQSWATAGKQGYRPPKLSRGTS